ncbi:hypothetical protein ASC77_10465 [Nocardioides sp. Root1257]|uniref:HNH endonuclease family protein n=1 Tax=unclassified Nocardioides TaxID=2615069 RepID=UPI0006FEFE33|nr:MULTISPECIES: HNH endonuclease family protein [unclassified Nocardioides]KQW49114.1 hypothetical protein ASC77_10465 [Nocardioides sp. Root1257]KRC48288.1 hypothetical protein ASE24_10470 [Nocardioides sp. Root224]
MARRLLLSAVCAVLASGAVVGVPSAAHAATYSAPLSQAVASLPVASEVRTGYDRDLFTLWTDADGDGCNTRNEVLIAEAEEAPSVGSGCALTGGRWFSYYDGVSQYAPADLDIDHMVPLAEAWDSGARSWSSAKRTSYANDLGDYRTLVAVTDSVNQTKSDQDPAEWLPAQQQCRYLREWVAVKHRWALSVDSAEKSALTSLAAGCSDVTITVETVS